MPLEVRHRLPECTQRFFVAHIFGQYPQTEFPAFQAGGEKDGHQRQEIMICFMEEAEMRAPRHVP